MKIPDTGRKKALVVVDLQPAFINDHNVHIVQRVISLIEKVEYDTYVAAVFSAEKGSIWDTQKDWTCPKDKETRTVSELRKVLAPKNILDAHKHTRSAFHGNQDVTKYLRDRSIEEVHIVGTETNDCVLATALDAFDSGFLTYVLEECSQSTEEKKHQLGLELLREHNMTNNSCLITTKTIEL
jgi:nicotinamidase-related amidase